MKIAVTAQGDDLTSEVDSRFGRTRNIIIYDTHSNDFQVHDNSINLNATQGAGIQTAQNIANLGAEATITCNLGPNAFKTLKAADIKVYLCDKTTVQHALEMFQQNKLEEMTEANVEGHWI